MRLDIDRDNISIHAPREGSDEVKAVTAAYGDISIHAPREGSDACLMLFPAQ